MAASGSRAAGTVWVKALVWTAEADWILADCLTRRHRRSL